MSYLPKARAENIVVQDLEKETLIYDLKTNKAFCLNETSALVWQLCDGKNSVAEISALMSKKLKTLISEDFVWLTLNELGKNKLLENEAELKNHFDRVSRREIVKRVGLASMVGLPMIASVMAPSSAQAQSGCNPDGESCFLLRDCCSGHCNTSHTCGCLPDGDSCLLDVDCCSSNCNSFDLCGCLPEGNGCSFNTDCCNGRCNARNFCQVCLPSGSSCVVNDDCCSGNCLNFGFMFCG